VARRRQLQALETPGEGAVAGNIGIGPRRPPTASRPEQRPPDATDRVAVAITASELRGCANGSAKTALFGSETDTEVVAHLVTDETVRRRPRR
jgi:glucosamine 6-phosphate synthetase-like amidotransferase/phosphosugar isomerase protein